MLPSERDIRAALRQLTIIPATELGSFHDGFLAPHKKFDLDQYGVHGIATREIKLSEEKLRELMNQKHPLRDTKIVVRMQGQLSIVSAIEDKFRHTLGEPEEQRKGPNGLLLTSLQWPYSALRKPQWFRE